MKPLPLAIVLIAAGLLSWWLFAPEDKPPPAGPDPLQADPSGVPESGSEQPGVKATAPASAGTQAAPPTQPTPQPTPKKKRKWIPPLSDKFIEKATWNDESGAVVLQHLAEAAGKRLRVGKGVQKRVENLRITLDMGRAAVSSVLSRVLLENTLAWHVENEYIVIYDNDD